MHRILSAFAVLLFLTTSSAIHAEALKPPVTGDMVKLTPFEKPVEIPRVILTSTKGITYLNEYLGKLVVLNIWATWCPPCVQELPSLNALQTSMNKNMFQVVTVSLDTGGLEHVKKYLADNHLEALPAYVDGNMDVQHLEVLKGVAGIPVTLIIDPQGKVLARVEGDADWNGRSARAVIDYYMKNISFSPL